MCDVEEILDSQFTYMRVNKVNIIPGVTDSKKKIRLAAFDPQGDNLSVDWAEKCTPEETKDRARKPENIHGVLQMQAIDIRKCPFELSVEHSPSNTNCAHTLVYGVPPRGTTDIGIRAQLLDLSDWILESNS